MLPKEVAGALCTQCFVLVPFDVDLIQQEEAVSHRYGASGQTWRESGMLPLRAARTFIA